MIMASPLLLFAWIFIKLLYIYVFILGIRLILAWSRANYFNPITRFIIKITQPLVAPIRRIIPTYAKIEFATVFWILLFTLLPVVIFGKFNLLESLFYCLAFDIKMILRIFFYSILLSAILSFFVPRHRPIVQVLTELSEPILSPVRRFIKPIGGLDFTPIPVLLILDILIQAIR